MPVLNDNFSKHLLKAAVKFEAFFKCCLRICALPIKQNIYVSIAACMQISAQIVRKQRQKKQTCFC